MYKILSKCIHIVKMSPSLPSSLKDRTPKLLYLYLMDEIRLKGSSPVINRPLFSIHLIILWKV